MISPDMVKPPDSDHIVASRIATFKVPKGFQLVPVPEIQARRSIIYKYGVKVVAEEDLKAMQQHATKSKGKRPPPSSITKKTITHTWHCLATGNCPSEGFLCKLKGNRTSNATEHLKLFHTLVSEKTKKTVVGNKPSFFF